MFCVPAGDTFDDGAKVADIHRGQRGPHPDRAPL